MRMSDFHPITLLWGSKPQTVSPFIRFLPKPLDKRNVVNAYVVRFEVREFLKQELGST